MATCAVIYQGASYPRFAGTRCQKAAPHSGERHFAYTGTGNDAEPLSWWTAEEKAARGRAP